MTRLSLSVPLVAPFVGDDEIDAVTAVLRSGQLAQGPETAAFEREFAPVAGTAHAVAVNSGTAANHAALAAFGLSAGDEVVTTPFTFAATATPILMERAVPRFVDIDPRTFNVDPAAMAAAVTSRTKAAVVVDLFGLPVDPAGVSLLRGRGVRVLEDACQSIGAERDGKRAGSIGEAASFSFYATKNIMTGEGGMLSTGDEAIAAAAKRFRQHGMGAQYEYLSLGYNYRMTDLAAAIGRVQLRRLDGIGRDRRAHAAFYDRELAGVAGLTTPFVPAGSTHAYHQYSILIDAEQTANGKDRDAVRAFLGEHGVGSGIYYPTPLHLHPLFAAFGYGPGDFPVAERVSRQILALPIHPLLSRDQLEHTVRVLRDAVGASTR
ncbi:MAG: DegT/DnrJ/EryC1/StrS family aminotransferase [Candidatus Eremiobacteraeota bacterium]|nr:DegT/DnrJ/EryC1/StrS family aminotransferase [Candidatus Eremiobacteraeota bacterium]